MDLIMQNIGFAQTVDKQMTESIDTSLRVW